MRHLLVCLALALPSAAILGGTLSCAASTVERESLLPALRAAWPSIRSDALLGGGDPTSVDAALAAGVRPSSWAQVEAAARVGISMRVSAGEISPGVAASFEERLRQFGVAIGNLSPED